MTTKITIIISIFALICGLLFVDIEETVYEWKNGPMLITPGFILKVNEAYSIEPDYFNSIKIIPMNLDVIGISHDPISNNSTGLTFIHDESFGTYTVSDSNQEPRAGAPIRYIKLSKLELNRLIDKIKFKDLGSRSEEKRKIIQKVNELFLYAKQDSLLSGYKEKQWKEGFPLELK